jgi:hypothetical protein
MGLATEIIRVQYACIDCRLGARVPKLESREPVCPSCREPMVQWPWKGNFPKKTSKLWSRLTVEEAYGSRAIQCDGKYVRTGPQGWDCHDDVRRKPADYRERKSKRQAR